MADEEIIKHSEINDVKLSAAAGGGEGILDYPVIKLDTKCIIGQYQPGDSTPSEMNISLYARQKGITNGEAKVILQGCCGTCRHLGHEPDMLLCQLLDPRNKKVIIKN